ncbi:hypothetical protein SIN09_25155 [Streptomyces sp. F8]|uniref:hypothetical protein n=1 Tax=Streptomyces sp. F8 TaxID=1436085 RepID=UPI0029CFDB94|nr:hypothetical protein [Streptomyces sp. F8]MDX6762616.1 hypothetical protein [Streptomyces sp. F8]
MVVREAVSTFPVSSIFSTSCWSETFPVIREGGGAAAFEARCSGVLAWDAIHQTDPELPNSTTTAAAMTRALLDRCRARPPDGSAAWGPSGCSRLITVLRRLSQ